MRTGRLVVVTVLIALAPAAPEGQAPEEPSQPASAETSDLVQPAQWRILALNGAIAAAAAVQDQYRRAEALASIARAQTQIADAGYDSTIHQALEASRRIAEAEFRGWALHDIVLAQIAAQDLLGARETANSIEAQRPQGAALAAVADFQLRSGDVAAAQATCARIRERRAKGEVLRQIVSLQAARGESRAARANLQSIDEPFYRALATGDVAVAELRGGHADRAHALAARARRGDRAQIYARLAIARADSGDIHGASETVRRIDDVIDRAVVQARIAAMRAAAGDSSTAEQSFVAALASIEPIKDSQRSAFALAQIARMQAINGNRSVAREVLGRALQRAENIEPGERREDTLDYIARTLARAGDAERALETARIMSDRIARALLVRDIVTLQADATSASASASAETFEDPLIDAAAQFGVLGVQLLKPGRSMSRETIAAALGAVRQIDDAQLRPAAFSALAAASVKSGDVAVSSAIFREALAAADAITSPGQRAAGFVAIVTALNDRLMFLGQPASRGGSREPSDDESIAPAAAQK